MKSYRRKAKIAGILIIIGMVAGLLVLFHSIDIITPVYMILNLPIALLEIILAIWLIVKGFDNSVIVAINNRPSL